MYGDEQRHIGDPISSVSKFECQAKQDTDGPFEASAKTGEVKTGEVKTGESATSEITRREFVATVGVVTGGVALGIPVISAEAEAQSSAAIKMVPVAISINGQKHRLSLDPRVSLLDLLREDLGMTGSKKGCDHGQCGACTVLANGRRINSCLSLAVVHDGDEITTIEGLGTPQKLHPMQAAFIEHDGFQCGYCTPGQICSAVALLQEAQQGDASIATKDIRSTVAIELTPDEVRERMSGNICRCGAYPGIVQAVRSVAGQKTGRS